jgi:outer membrane lipoprotein SlyB
MNKRILGRAVLAGAVLGACVATQASAQTAPPVRVRGTVETVQGQDLTVKSRDGSNITIKLAPDYAVTGVVRAALSDVTVGTFVGIAALPAGSGPEKAVEVVVFPESGRGSGEGHYPWDLAPGSTMTNATVTSEVANVDGPTLTLKHKDGETSITVPKDVPVVTFGPGDKGLLVPGAHVFVPAMKQADGTLMAGRVLVGKDGVTPPM